jgi:hypothetical protein
VLDPLFNLVQTIFPTPGNKNRRFRHILVSTWILTDAASIASKFASETDVVVIKDRRPEVDGYLGGSFDFAQGAACCRGC